MGEEKDNPRHSVNRVLRTYVLSRNISYFEERISLDWSGRRVLSFSAIRHCGSRECVPFPDNVWLPRLTNCPATTFRLREPGCLLLFPDRVEWIAQVILFGCETRAYSEAIPSCAI